MQAPLNVRLTYSNGDTGNTALFKRIPEGETCNEQTNGHTREGE